MSKPHPHHIQRWADCRAATASKAAAGLRILAGRRFNEPVVIEAETFAIRDHGDGIRSIPEPILRRDATRDRDMRVSLPYVAIQHGEVS